MNITTTTTTTAATITVKTIAQGNFTMYPRTGELVEVVNPQPPHWHRGVKALGLELGDFNKGVVVGRVSGYDPRAESSGDTARAVLAWCERHPEAAAYSADDKPKPFRFNPLAEVGHAVRLWQITGGDRRQFRSLFANMMAGKGLYGH